MKTLPFSVQKISRIVIISLVALIHIILMIYMKFTLQTPAPEVIEDANVIKLVDIREYIPPPPPPEPRPPEKKIQVADQPAASETIIEVAEEVEVVAEAVPVVPEKPQEAVYLPQHKISKVPVIPTDEVQGKIVYPPMALRQNLEAVVYVELYIDASGLVRRVVVLKDPGHGFADSAITALEGLQCEPAEANGTPVAVRYRYPIRFVLN